jgi:hypothetical protein
MGIDRFVGPAAAVFLALAPSCKGVDKATEAAQQQRDTGARVVMLVPGVSLASKTAAFCEKEGFDAMEKAVDGMIDKGITSGDVITAIACQKKACAEAACLAFFGQQREAVGCAGKAEREKEAAALADMEPAYFVPEEEGVSMPTESGVPESSELDGSVPAKTGTPKRFMDAFSIN